MSDLKSSITSLVDSFGKVARNVFFMLKLFFALRPFENGKDSANGQMIYRRFPSINVNLFVRFYNGQIFFHSRVSNILFTCCLRRKRSLHWFLLFVLYIFVDSRKLWVQKEKGKVINQTQEGKKRRRDALKSF